MMVRKQVIKAIFYKQIKELVKNSEILILFFVYPLVGAIMSLAMKGQMQGSVMFTSIFATMHSVFTPIVTTAAIISEEKEKNTLRVLMMSTVKPLEYLASIGSFIFICTLFSGSLFLLIGNYTGVNACLFLLYLSVGTLLSIMIGMSIGVYTKNRMSANSLAVPIGLILSFFPMLGGFNQTISKVSRWLYTGQVSEWIAGSNRVTFKGILLIGVYAVIFSGLFVLLFRKNKWDD
jgi:ABC-2 type transport system permease protein